MEKQSILLAMAVLLATYGWAAAYSGGTGEPNDPYIIATAEDMNAIGADSNDWDKHFLLVADINLADYTGTQFNIIGNDSNAFTGVFDGNEHTISNFTYECADTEYIGFFAYVDAPNAEVKNLTLIDPNVNATGHSHGVAGLVGYLKDGTISSCSVEGGSISGYWTVGGLAGDNKGTISNCSATGLVSGHAFIGGLVGCNLGMMENCYATANVRGFYEAIGGLVGSNYDGKILNCYATGNVYVSGILEAMGVGGLAGDNYGSDAMISNCYATGTVNAYGSYSVGGLAGRNRYGEILNSYATGSVVGTAGTGGLVGSSDGTITNCYATGSVSGSGSTGGLVGYNYGSDAMISNCYATGSILGDSCIGGLVGYHYNGMISNCYAIGPVDGNDIGGLVGYYYSGSYTSCFWDSDVNPDVNGIGNSIDPNVIAKSTEEMKTENTFNDADWDFIDIWDIGENQTYPFLRVYLAGDINHDDIVNFYDLAILAGHWLEGIE